MALDVSICSAIAWTDRGWCDSVIHIFNEFGEKSLKCIDVWKKYLGKERLKKPNYHKKYSRMMYCHDDFGGDSYEEDKEVNLRFGVREIDINLYFYVCFFDFKKVKELLDNGANPEAEFYLDEDLRSIDDISGPIDRVMDEVGFLGNQLLHFYFEEYVNDREQKVRAYDSLVYQLISWGAHTDMYNLLTDKDNHKDYL